MAQKKLKVIPIYRFFQIMDRPSQILFGVLFLGLIGLCIGTVVAVDNPVRWSMDVVEVPARFSEEVTLAEYEANYRTQTATVEAWKENVAFGGRMIGPREWMVWVFLAAQVLGWAIFLTAATYIKEYYVYGAFFLFALFVLSSRMFEAVMPGTSWLVGLGILVATVAPAFLIQQGYIKLKFLARFAIFLVLVGGPFVALHEMAGWQGLHRTTAELLRMAIFFGLVFIIFIGTEINNTLFYLTTNAKKKKYRARLPVILGLFIVLIGLQFMMLQDAMGWDFVEIPSDFPFRPMHLIAFSAVVMVGTKQNLYPKLKDFIPNRGMSFGFLGAAIIAMGIFFYHSLLGEHMFIRSFERIAIIVFFLTSLFHFFYILYNFEALLRARLNFYYITMLPRRLMFFFVIIATFLVGGALEASKYFASRKALSATLYNRLGDAAMIENKVEEAMVFYRTAVGVAQGTPKGNYNLAMLAWTVNNARDNARKYFRQAGQFYDFPFSFINLAQMELENGLAEQAKYYLQEGEDRMEDHYLYNNLAQVYLLLEEPDTAIIYMKKALELAPSESALYGNLGKIYMDFGRYEEAEDFFRAGLEVSEPSPLTVTNALYLNLAHGTSIPVTDSLVRQEGIREHLPAWFNLAIDRFRKEDYAGARTVIDSLESQLDSTLPDSLKGALRPPEVLFLDGCVMFHEGLVENAKSRMQSLDEEHRQMKRFTQHFLGAAYHGAGVPEMAAVFYEASASKNDQTDDWLNQALMKVDAGDHDKAFQALSRLQLLDSTWVPQITKEIAMLQYAHGQHFMASVGFDLGELTREEWMRVGLYAGQIRNMPSALEAFRKIIIRDSSDTAPYLEMGRISLRHRDPLAKDNLQPGLDLEPNNLDLRVEMARALLQEGDVKSALAIGNAVHSESPEEIEVQILQAELAVAQQDTAAAIALLDTLNKQYPLKVSIVRHLAKLYRAQRKDFLLHGMLTNARALNERNAEIEYELAHAEKFVGRIFDSAEAAKRAMAMTPDSVRRSEIEIEFAKVFEASEMGEDGFFFFDDVFKEEK